MGAADDRSNGMAGGSRAAARNRLPGLDCGLCGSKTCDEFAGRLDKDPELARRCIPLAAQACPPGPDRPVEPTRGAADAQPVRLFGRATGPAVGALLPESEPASPASGPWRDGLGREFDFFLEHFPEDPGPREIILPHNPQLTRELQIAPGDVLVGRPLGMSCGCPVTHCGVVTAVDQRTGVLTWCVTGPLQPRRAGAKDIGYYAAEAYEGLIRERRAEIRIGQRYFFQPRMCMLQWRHSGLVNYMNRTAAGLQVRLEGLWIG
jgi:uncharacterized Fe-S cluster-containing protein